MKVTSARKMAPTVTVSSSKFCPLLGHRAGKGEAANSDSVRFFFRVVLEDQLFFVKDRPQGPPLCDFFHEPGASHF